MRRLLVSSSAKSSLLLVVFVVVFVLQNAPLYNASQNFVQVFQQAWDVESVVTPLVTTGSNDSTASIQLIPTSRTAQSPPPPPSRIKIHNESFSACLLVMDENFRLHEWISYHYHVLPLRYLVVAVDPRSQHSPEPIFQQFRQLLNITIISWTDTDFSTFGPLAHNAGPKLKRKRHLARQRQFLAKCMHYLHQNNRTWTALWDTDEYISYNPFGATKTNPSNGKSATAPENMSAAGSILRYLNDYGEDKCVTMPRVLVGSKETPGLMNETTHPFDARRFDTLRFRFRGSVGDKDNGFGKSLLNVQKISNFPVIVRNPHRPVFEICTGVYGGHVSASPFYLNHFIGTWEAYSYRDDSRRGQEKNYETYMARATGVKQNKHYENKLSQWMPAFCQDVGQERATALLQNAGLDPSYNASFKIEAWKIL